MYPENSFYMPGAFRSSRSGSLGWNKGKSCSFDSELTASVGNSVNATLTITLKLHLVKRDKNSGIALRSYDGKPFPLRNWDVATNEFGRFTEGVQKEAEDFWGRTAFCLVTPDDYRGLDWPQGDPVVHPNVDCQFKLDVVKSAEGAHAVIDCFRPDKDDPEFSFFRSNVSRVPGVFQGHGQFTNFDVLLRNSDLARDCEIFDWVLTGKDLDMEYRKVLRKCMVKQRTLAHEIGHLIGLPHVGEIVGNPDCKTAMDQDPKEGGNAPACYNGRNEGETENVMGRGMKLAPWNAMPWALRFVDHVGIHPSGVRISMGTRKPRTIQRRA